MIIDLTLNAVKFPGLENFTPPFGTKKADNVGLTTLEGCNNIAKPWQDQRPIAINENSTFSAEIERNALINIVTESITLTMVDAAFAGCEVKILTTFTTGHATVLIGSTSYNLQPASIYILLFDGAKWFFDNGDKTPVGNIISFMGKTAPLKYLQCDGTVYNIADYPAMARFILEQFETVDFFGGDGETTFAVPDLRGEFLRGTGTNGHTGEGNGAAVGAHQAASNVVTYRGYGTGVQLCRATYNSENFDVLKQTNSVYAGNIENFNWSGQNSTNYVGTTRPTNTSVLYCIKYI